jgi:hypothetical protein
MWQTLRGSQVYGGRIISWQCNVRLSTFFYEQPSRVLNEWCVSYPPESKTGSLVYGACFYFVFRKVTAIPESRVGLAEANHNY